MIRILLYILFGCLLLVFSCNRKKEQVIYIQNNYVNLDSLHLIIKDNEGELVNQYLKKGKTNESYTRILIKRRINDSAEITAILPQWKIENKTMILDRNIIIVVINTMVDEDFLKRKMKELNTIKDSALIPKISIDFR